MCQVWAGQRDDNGDGMLRSRSSHLDKRQTIEEDRIEPRIGGSRRFHKLDGLSKEWQLDDGRQRGRDNRLDDSQKRQEQGVEEGVVHVEKNKSTGDRTDNYQYDRFASPRVQAARAFEKQQLANVGSRYRRGIAKVRPITESEVRTIYDVICAV